MKLSVQKKSRGITMIEVLVAMLIAAIGLLGLAGITIVVLKSNSLAQQVAEATSISTDMINRLKRVPFNTLPDCDGATYDDDATTCELYTDSSLVSKGSNFLPVKAIYNDNDTDGCVVPGVFDASTESTFSIVDGNLSQSGFTQPAENSGFCAAQANLDGNSYLRFYRVSSVGGSAAQRRLVVGVVFRNARGQYRVVMLDTVRFDR